MKTEYYFSQIYSSQMPKAAWTRLIKLCPKGYLGSQFGGSFDASNPMTSQVIALLDSVGLRPWENQTKPMTDNEYVFAIDRMYTPADLACCEMIEMEPKSTMCGCYFDRTDKRAFIVYDEIYKKHKSNFVSNVQKGCFVSDPIRKFMKAESLVGPKFVAWDLRGAYIRHPDGTVENPMYDWRKFIPNGAWWQLISSVVLPTVSSRIPLQDPHGKPLPAGTTEGCTYIDGFYTKSELHYARSSLKGLPEFDVAVTREYWSGPSEDIHRRLMVSQRFLRLAIQQKWRLDFRPVHIDEDL